MTDEDVDLVSKHGVLRLYEKDGTWCFNSIGFHGVEMNCLGNSREFAQGFLEEFIRAKRELEQRMLYGKDE